MERITLASPSPTVIIPRDLCVARASVLMIVRGVIGKWYFFTENAMFFARPLAEVDESATLAAKGAPQLEFGPFHLGAAGGTVNKGAHIMQQVSLNDTS
jgi:hypothetical protein